MSVSSNNDGVLVADRFIVYEQIGAGGMGVVHRGFDCETGVPVAIKFLSDATNDKILRFQQEARVLGALTHPTIVRFLDFGITPDGAFYLAMEWLDGIDLSERLAQSLLTVTETARVGRLIAEALAAAHHAGIVHRDLKPQNVFLEGSSLDRIKLIDFGIAVFDDHTTGITGTGRAIGTPEYMAPEQARGERPLGPAADLHALGAVLFECLTGATPFTGPTAAAILASLLFSEAPRLSARAPHTPPPLDMLVGELLQKDPKLRPASALEVFDRLIAIEQVGSLRPSAVRTTITIDEQRLITIVCVRPAGAKGGAETRAMSISEEGASEEDIPVDAHAFGAKVVHVKGHGFVLVFVSDTPSEAARSAAHAALHLVRRDPGRRLGVASGAARTKTDLDRAFVETTFALATKPGVIRLNDIARQLLSDALDVELTSDGPVLRSEQRKDAVSASSFVGREREVGGLIGAFQGVVDEHAPQLVLVVAPPGMGKSRLVHEFSAKLEGRAPPSFVVRVRGEEVRRTTPFATLATIVRRVLGISPAAQPQEQLDRLASGLADFVSPDRTKKTFEYLAVALGIATSTHVGADVLAADPVRMEEGIELATADLLRGLAEDGSVVLVVDDAHWVDGGTLRVLTRTLVHLEESPLFIVLCARPEIDEHAPRGCLAAVSQRIQLGGLPRRACRELAGKVLGSEVTAEEIDSIVARSEGNPLFLQELIAVRAGDPAEVRGALPPNVLASVEARLLRLDPSARKLLRAASVFGGVFWDGGVAALLGRTSPESVRLGEWLVQLVSMGVLVPSRTTRFGGQGELAFAHALVRDAAFAMLPPEERALAHRLAAQWLQDTGERDPLVLATHHEAAGDRAAAARSYVDAAQLAFERNDLDHALVHAGRATSLGVDERSRRRLALLVAETEMWLGHLDDAERAVKEAVGAFEHGTQEWLDALSVQGSILARAGSADVIEVVEQLLAAVQPSPTLYPRPSTIYALVSSTLRLGRGDLARSILDVLGDAVLTRSNSPLAIVYVLMGRSWEATYDGDYAAAVSFDLDTLDKTLAAGEVRQTILARIYVGHDWMMLGAYERAREELERAAAEAKGARMTSLEMNALHNLALALHRLGDTERGLTIQQACVAFAQAKDNELFEQQARRYLSIQLLEAGRDEEALRELAFLSDPRSPTWTQADANAKRSIMLLRSDEQEARRVAEEALTAFESLRNAEEGEATIRLCVAQVFFQLGELERSRGVLSQAVTRLERLAQKIQDPVLRKSFIERIPEHASTVALAARLGIATTLSGY